MRYPRYFITAILICVTGFLFSMENRKEELAHPEKVQEAIEKVKPSIVRIEVVISSDRQGRKVKNEASGSGVIISSDGYVITNHHVAGKAEYILCTLADRQRMEADLIGTDPLTDTTVLKLREEGPYPYASFGDSAEARVGDEVLALGSPMALSQSVTRGIVSNTELIMPDIIAREGILELDGEDVGSVVRWIGHDAAIHRGNSGGPLINLDGEIIGINEIDLGLGGAIPGNLVQDVAEKIIEDGHVRRSWFGFQLQPLLRSSDVDEGVLLSGPVKNSPADKAGFKAGDIIQRVGEETLTAQFPEELPLINKSLMNFPINEEVDVIFLRNGEEKTLAVTPDERERRLPDSFEAREWGFTYRDLSRFDVIRYDLENRAGILITSIRPGGAAADAKPDIKAEDILVQINGRDITDKQDFRKVTESVVKDIEAPTPVMVKYIRNNQEYLTVVELGERDIMHSPRTTTRAWLPFETQVLTSKLAEQKGIKDTTGVRITRIYQHFLEEETDVKVGDIITALDGDPVPASSTPEDDRIFTNMVRQYRIDSDIELSILRNGESKDIVLTTQASPPERREMDRYENLFFEFTLREISPLERMQRTWDEDMEGVIVDEVTSGSWAALANLRSRDVIRKINNRPVPDLEKARTILKEVEEEQPEAVVVKVLRDKDTRYLEITPEWEEY